MRALDADRKPWIPRQVAARLHEESSPVQLNRHQVTQGSGRKRHLARPALRGERGAKERFAADCTLDRTEEPPARHRRLEPDCRRHADHRTRLGHDLFAPLQRDHREAE